MAIDAQQAAAMSDEEVVALALLDKEVFLFIVHRYRTKLLKYLSRLTNGSNEDLEDILQDIFLKVYRNLNDFDDSLKFSSWIYAIARNEAVSAFRKKKVRPEGHATALDAEGARQLAAESDLAANLDTDFLRSRIGTVLSQLDVKYREVLILRFFEEKNYQEISDIIKRPPGTVASLLNRAKAAFRREVAKMQFYDRGQKI